MYNIFTILCENEKYLVHCSQTTEDDIIYFECIILYEFARLHNPIQIIEKRCGVEFSDIDTEVKMKMYFHGINNVRGGSYRQTILSESIRLQLSEDIKTLTTRPVCDEIYTAELIEFYTSLDISSKDKCHSYIAEFEKELAMHLEYKGQYNEMACVNINGNIFTITSAFNDELMWLYSKINCSSIEITPECKVRYETIVTVIKHMVKIYVKMKDIDNINPMLLYPKHEFDKYIYHRKSSQPSDKDIINSLSLWNKIETVYYFISNKLDEHIFDMGDTDPAYAVDIRNKIDILRTISARL